MRIKGNPATILAPGQSPGAIPGGDNFVSEIRRAIADFKGLIEAAKDLQQLGGINQPFNPPATEKTIEVPYKQLAKTAPTPQAANSPGITEFITYLVAAGYGDKPIGDLLDQVKPVTLNQLLKLAQNKGAKGAKSGE